MIVKLITAVKTKILFFPMLVCVALVLADGLSARATATESIDANILVSENASAEYQLFLAGRNLDDVTYYGGDFARRDVIELVLLMQALKIGGFQYPLRFDTSVSQNYSRSIRTLQNANALAIGATTWSQDVFPQQHQLFISQPIIKKGQFNVGVYTSPQNTLALSSKTPEQLKRLTIVTSDQWQPDVETLNSFGFAKILMAPKWNNMALMVRAGRADITLAPFPAKANKKILVNGVVLVPIEGIKMNIKGTRHFVVSRSHPYGAAFFEALNKGFKKMNEKGIVERAYRESGFFNRDTEKWQLMNP